MTASDLVLPAFFADALALGPHWIYDADEIRGHYPDGFSNYDDPRSQYHPGKSAGDFTHYGDQALALLRALRGMNGHWSASSWQDCWTDWAKHSTAYRDGATRKTLENLDNGRREPSDSHDLAGASRIAPLFGFLEGDILLQAAREQTALTHGDPRVVDAAEFFARATLAVASGAEMADAFEQATAEPYEALPAIDWLAATRSAGDEILEDAAAGLGLSCDVDGAFQLTLLLALGFEDRPVEALTTNALLGGDSAARGLLLGLLLGAKHGVRAFPDNWLADLGAGREIVSLLPAS